MKPWAFLVILIGIALVLPAGAQDLFSEKKQIPISHVLLDNKSGYYNESLYERINATVWDEWAYRDVLDWQIEYAIKEYDQAIKNDPYFVRPWNNKGVLLTLLGNYNESLACYEKALEMDPRNDIIWNNKGDVLIRLGRLDEALASLNRSLDINPDNSIALNNKGVVLAQTGGNYQAMSLFNNSLQLSSEDSVTWSNKGVALARTGNLKKALECFRQSAIINKNGTAAWINGAVALKEMGQREKAEEAMTGAKILGFNSTAKDYVLESVPQLLKKQGRSNAIPGWEGYQAAGGILVCFEAIIRKSKKIRNHFRR